MIFLFVFALFVIILGIFFLFVLSRQRKTFGILAEEERIYQDTEKMPGETLFAKTLPLVGRPDYLIKRGEYIIPVEKKNTKAPRDQYVNNNMQLMAYCLLVQETFGIRPPGGYRTGMTKWGVPKKMIFINYIAAHRE